MVRIEGHKVQRAARPKHGAVLIASPGPTWSSRCPAALARLCAVERHGAKAHGVRGGVQARLRQPLGRLGHEVRGLVQQLQGTVPHQRRRRPVPYRVGRAWPHDAALRVAVAIGEGPKGRRAAGAIGTEIGRDGGLALQLPEASAARPRAFCPSGSGSPRHWRHRTSWQDLRSRSGSEGRPRGIGRPCGPCNAPQGHHRRLGGGTAPPPGHAYGPLSKPHQQVAMP